MKGTRKRPWSDLPPEILSMIGSRLHTRVDVLRFRSVCSSFRSSIPLLRPDAPRFPLQVPSPLSSPLFLRESTVYAIETPDGAASGCARWLLKLEDKRNLSVFSRRAITSLPHKFPEVLDSLQFRIVEFCREYTIEYGGDIGKGFVQPTMRRTVVHPDCVWTDVDQLLVYFIGEERKLGYWKYGDESLTYLDYPQGDGYDDIIVYEGKICVVDELGLVWQIDSSFRLRSFSLPIESGDFGSKHLVVSSGDLYVVNIYHSHCGMAWDFSAYRLDRQCGRWEEVRSLGNSAFFLCNHCYAEHALLNVTRENATVFNLAYRHHELPDFSGLLR